MEEEIPTSPADSLQLIEVSFDDQTKKIQKKPKMKRITSQKRIGYERFITERKAYIIKKYGRHEERGSGWYRSIASMAWKALTAEERKAWHEGQISPPLPEVEPVQPVEPVEVSVAESPEVSEEDALTFNTNLQVQNLKCLMEALLTEFIDRDQYDAIKHVAVTKPQEQEIDVLINTLQDCISDQQNGLLTWHNLDGPGYMDTLKEMLY